MEKYFLFACVLLCQAQNEKFGSQMRPFSGGANIIRPCPSLEKRCIRQYFAKHGHCKKVSGPVPEPLYRKQSTVFFPKVNITVTLTKIEVKGLNARIKDFYINRETDKAVLFLEFQGLTYSSNRTFFRFHRRGKEPVVTKDYAWTVYKTVDMTAIIPQVDNLNLEKAVVFTYVNDAAPQFSVGPNVLTSDPTVQFAFSQLILDLPTSIKEFFLTDGAYYVTTFIQYSICDFGLKIL